MVPANKNEIERAVEHYTTAPSSARNIRGRHLNRYWYTCQVHQVYQALNKEAVTHIETTERVAAAAYKQKRRKYGNRQRGACQQPGTREMSEQTPEVLVTPLSFELGGRQG